MTDRVPGAPGQYILTVSAEETQKVLTGEPVTVTLKRDDQPLVEGTPYNKASVLPDELASILCPGVLDPTPADAFSGVLKKAAPYNYAHNSDFTQFVAHAGIGGNHGTQAYAGDRWILDSGTVTGEARTDGNGYTNIRLNGTIRQIVENAPNVGTAAIDMVSGTADISYAHGEITITSNGGVIKNVRLFAGVYTTENIPNYQPKGYGAELVACASADGWNVPDNWRLIWANERPTDSFAPQTVTFNLDEGFSENDEMLIIFKLNTTQTQHTSMALIGRVGFRVGMFTNTKFGSRVFWAAYNNNKGTGMVFEAGNFDGAVANDYIIPVKIYLKRRAIV